MISIITEYDVIYIICEWSRPGFGGHTASTAFCGSRNARTKRNGQNEIKRSICCPVAYEAVLACFDFLSRLRYCPSLIEITSVALHCPIGRASLFGDLRLLGECIVLALSEVFWGLSEAILLASRPNQNG